MEPTEDSLAKHGFNPNRRPANPKFDGEITCAKITDTGTKRDKIIYSIKAKCLPYLARSKRRTVMKRSVTTTYDIVGISVTRPPGDWATGLGGYTAGIYQATDSY